MVFIFPLTAAAQDTGGAARQVWVQIEAQPTLAEARARARVYARDLPDVNGFALGRGWYAIALGPYREDEAERVLQVYRREGVIARDSYIARSSDFGRRFWPVGDASAPAPAPEEAPLVTAPDPAPQPEPGETLREARAGEARLSREEREELQVALQWAGVYDGAIDAAFGRGTRGAMARWQQQNGFEPTGVLTTRQRAALMGQYNAVLEDLGLETVRDTRAGIEIDLPLGVVEFDRHEAPFAHYQPSGSFPAQVLLISQPGDRTTMTALYDIMQSLEIVPETGPRALESDGFTLTGEGRDTVSHTRVWLRGREIKGFTLVWPAGDEARLTRLLEEMEDSFTPLPGTLDAIVAPATGQRVDLVAGLDVRRPDRVRTGFFVDARGAVMTAAEAVQGCGRITINETTEADIAHLDEAFGVAVLRPRDQLAPAQVARFRDGLPAVLSRVAVAGYSYEGLLGAPTVTFGQLAALEGLDGETHLKRLALSARAGDAGGPVLDGSGAVLGMLVPYETEGRSLPEGVSFAATNGALRAVLDAGGVTPRAATVEADLSGEALTDRAEAMTALVGCWE
ncbi:peptidoglycan-binding protein [Roseovarius sp. A46]|uniref:serine protease n=1 Tax=Roseovarius sp. A46 TaxID=2109331 RepID=UPI001010ADCF|nr:serine protease [Roseovarius sp. A46]RXV66543.1 peptidoglycan-binding protein [Roseovarius sp. A46]